MAVESFLSLIPMEARSSALVDQLNPEVNNFLPDKRCHQYSGGTSISPFDTSSPEKQLSKMNIMSLASICLA
jgi:hypothetical protein